MKHDNYAVYIIILVGIVGIVALSSVMVDGKDTLAGQAFMIQQCYDSDKGNDPYITGRTIISTSTTRLQVKQDKCFDGSNFVQSCSGSMCQLYEYYCDANNVVSLEIYDILQLEPVLGLVYCWDGEINIGSEPSQEEEELPDILEDEPYHDSEGEHEDDETYPREIQEAKEPHNYGR